MGSLATLVPERERARVAARAAQLGGMESRDWTGPAEPELSRRVCLAVTAIAPTLPHRRLALLARYAGWSIRLDDRLDRPEADPGALHRLRDAVAAATVGRPLRQRSAPADPVPDQLVGILAELAGLDRSGGAAVGRFGAALRDAVDCGVWHALLGRAVAAGTRPPPTAEQYLAVAARTVNYRSFGYALLALTGAGDLDRAVDRALWYAAGAVRLANDLRSRERDRAEQTLNVLQLRTAAGAPVTGAWVRAGIERRRQAHEWALASAPAPAGVLIRCLRISIALYQLGDLRDQP